MRRIALLLLVALAPSVTTAVSSPQEVNVVNTASTPANVKVLNNVPVTVSNQTAIPVTVTNQTTPPSTVTVNNTSPIPVQGVMQGQVEVVNSVPVPVSAPNPLAVSGNVQVTNLPVVQAVTGTVTVANPTTIPNPLPVQVMNSAGPASSVTVSNDTAHPVPVSVKSNPLYFAHISVSTIPTPDWLDITPAPARNVAIDGASGWCVVPSGGSIWEALVLSYYPGPDAAFTPLAFQRGGTSPYGTDTYVLSQPVPRFYVYPVPVPGVSSMRISVQGTAGSQCYFAFSGHYLDEN